MGKLYDARMRIDKIIQQKNLDVFKTRGAINLKTGIMISMINESTPDDEAKLQKIKSAVLDILGVSI